MLNQDSDQDSSADSKASVKLDPRTVSQVLLDHMKTLRASTDWGIAIATTSLLLAVAGVEQTILGIRFSAKGEVWAYFTAAAVYLAVITVLGRQLLGLGYLVEIAKELIPAEDFHQRSIEFVVPIITYPWFFNPFTYCGGIIFPGTNQDLGEDRVEPGNSGQALQTGIFGLKEEMLGVHPTPPWGQCFRNLSGAAGGVALILAWWMGFVGLHLMFSEVEVASYWGDIIGWLMVLAGLLALFAVWKVLCIICEVLIAGRSKRKDRLVFYESTVLARLVAFSLTQAGMIAFCCYIVRMPSWKVFPTTLVLVLLVALGIRFSKRYLPGSKGKTGSESTRDEILLHGHPRG